MYTTQLSYTKYGPVMANGACLVVLMVKIGKSGTLLFVRSPRVSFFLNNFFKSLFWLFILIIILIIILLLLLLLIIIIIIIIIITLSKLKGTRSAWA